MTLISAVVLLGLGIGDAPPMEASAPTSKEPGAKKKACAKWGLLLPVLSIRFTSFDGVTPQANSLEISGPLRTFGAGRNFSLCGEDQGRDWAVTSSVFAFTQGLDPNGLLQLGVGASLGVMVEDLFSFGIGVGYDLVRIQSSGAGRSINGLFTFQNLGGVSLSYFLIFQVALPR